MREPPSGMDVTFTDRGFELNVVGELPGGAAGCFRSLAPPVFLVQLVFGFICLGMTIEGELQVAYAVVAAITAVFVGIVLAIFWSRANTPRKGRLVLDGERLAFTSQGAGEVEMSLEDIKGVDVIPVGLAIRPKKGVTHHVMMVNTSDAARRWLDEAIEEARKRYGTSAEVPESIGRLKRREKERE